MLRSTLEGLVELVFPTTCYACLEYEPLHDHLLCISCLENLPWVPKKAARAALEGKENFPSGVDHFDSLLYFSKSSKVQQLITAIKYNGQKRLAEYLGARLGEKIQDTFSGRIHELIPVPVHKKRRRERGYNQAEEIAKGVANKIALPINRKLLIRNQYEQSQTSKDKHERAARLKESFAINPSSGRQADHAILVDDVVTTGATINSCIQQLNKCGYKSISVVTLAVSI